jgi:hypothetical protein
MAVITFPTALESYVAQQAIGQRRFDTFDASDVTGAVDVVVGGPPRWTMQLAAHDGMELPIAGQWDALLLQLRGGVNHLAMHDFLRPLPTGTARGSSITTSSTTALGASAVAVAGATHRDNLLAAIERLDAPEWGIGVAPVTANTHTAPDGGLTADTVTDNVTTSTLARGQVRGVPADASWYTVSCFVRKTTGGTQPTFSLQLYLEGGTAIGNEPRFNTDTGAALPGIGTGSVQDAGAYWRVSASLQNNGTNTLARVMVAPAIAAHGQVVADPTVMGSAVVWGFELKRESSVSAYAGHPTLRAGDWLQIGTGVGSHLAKVTADVSLVDGAGSVSFEPPTRQSYASGSAVRLEKALGHFKRAQSNAGWNHVPGALMSGGHSLELVEQWT